jgi:hypothetical protein
MHRKSEGGCDFTSEIDELKLSINELKKREKELL